MATIPERDAFLKLLAHELRSPLTTILGWVELASSNHEPKTVSRALEAIDRSARAQLSMVNRLSDFAKYVMGEPALANELFELSEAVTECAQTLDEERAEKGHTLRYSPPASPILLNGDQDELVKALRVVLENAYRYTPPMGQIGIDITKSGSSVSIEIVDNGVGLGHAALQRLLGSASAGEPPIAIRGGGLGIGLAVARAIVQLHGGSISAKSKPGSGSSFSLLLPLSSIPVDPTLRAPGGLAV